MSFIQIFSAVGYPATFDEKGNYTEIPFLWNDKSQSLTIGQRRGSYSNMIQSRTFDIVLPNGKIKTIAYSGKKLEVILK